MDIRTENLPHGEVTGNICYPSEFNLPMTLCFEMKGTKAVQSTNQVIQFSIPENTPTYKVLLPNGRYYAYARAPGYSLEGAYVHPERVMKSFIVKSGETTSGINICDWEHIHMRAANKSKGDLNGSPFDSIIANRLGFANVKNSFHLLWRQPAVMPVILLLELILLIPPHRLVAI